MNPLPMLTFLEAKDELVEASVSPWQLIGQETTKSTEADFAAACIELATMYGAIIVAGQDTQGTKLHVWRTSETREKYEQEAITLRSGDQESKISRSTVGSAVCVGSTAGRVVIFSAENASHYQTVSTDYGKEWSTTGVMTPPDPVTQPFLTSMKPDTDELRVWTVPTKGTAALAVFSRSGEWTVGDPLLGNPLRMARDNNDLVAVLTQSITDMVTTISVYVSENGGMTWGPAMTVVTGENIRGVAMCFNDGYLYVSWITGVQVYFTRTTTKTPKLEAFHDPVAISNSAGYFASQIKAGSRDIQMISTVGLPVILVNESAEQTIHVCAIATVDDQDIAKSTYHLATHTIPHTGVGTSTSFMGTATYDVGGWYVPVRLVNESTSSLYMLSVVQEEMRPVQPGVVIGTV